MAFNFLKPRTCREIAKPLEADWLLSPIVKTPMPTIGVVIGTYGKPAYIALQLEARRRYFPAVPMLIHDDGSPEGPELKDMCHRSGADFRSSSERLGWSLGDMAAIIAGLDWGREHNLDIIVKLSRRFLIFHEWIAQLQDLAYTTQYATYGNACGYYDLPFRPECMGMHTDTWHRSGAVEEMRHLVLKGLRVENTIECWYQKMAQKIHLSHAPATVRYRESVFPYNTAWSGYAIWNIMGLSRHSAKPNLLWHDINPATDYFELAQSWGITDYTKADFEMPSCAEAVREESRVMRLRNPDFERRNLRK